MAILKDLYQRFLVGPRPAALAPDVSVSYITTTTKFDGADAVLSHLTKQDHVVKRKSEQVIAGIEGDNSVCVDVETTLEFVSGGGAYLPSLDDNFLADRVATFPTLHVVHFNSQNQIQQIRIYWDQASLLKQVEVIGARGRGWPIREAKEQTRFIKTAASLAAAPTRRTNQSNDDPENSEESKRASPGKKHIKDPHAAGSLYELLSPEKDRAEAVRAPRAPASAKPPPREYNELFVHADDPDDADVPDATPSKSRNIAPKAGASKKFGASRIFDDDETAAADRSHPQIAYRANPKRFDHFEIGADNSQREIQDKPSRPGSRHVPHWDFGDFATPEKPKRQPRGEEIRHFGWSDDEPEPTPVFQKHVPQPRRDADTHFDLTGQGEDEEANKPRYIRAYGNKGMSLYKNHLFDDADEDKSNENAPLSTVNNGPNRKEFESHWTATDESPADGKSNENKKPVGADRQRALKNMESQWEAYDESPQPSKFVRPPPQRRAVRQVNERSWGLGDE